jgi:transposase
MGRGLPIRPSLTAGQSHDGQAADGLLDHIGAGTILLADKAYDADRIRASLRERAFANIPPKSNRRSKPYFSTWLYRERNLIERFFSKLKHFRLSTPG